LLIGGSLAFSPLIVTYCIEILPYNIRAKGFNIFNITISVALVFNQYVNPIALGKLPFVSRKARTLNQAIAALTWKYYVVYCVWLVCECTFLYFCGYPSSVISTLIFISVNELRPRGNKESHTRRNCGDIRWRTGYRKNCGLSRNASWGGC
jgi:hypothetical protein